MRLIIRSLLFILSVLPLQLLIARDHPSSSLKELLKQAVVNYPLLKAREFEVLAAQKGVEASKRSLVPTLDAAYQANFATYNNIIGMASSTFLVPISGPPSTGNNYEGVFGSSASMILNWQPITFGQRTAQVDYSKAGLHQTLADTQNEIFQHKVKVIYAYLDALVAKELVKVYEKNLFRTEINYQSMRAMVLSGLKPGVDTAMYKAEMSRAKIDLMNIRKYREQTSVSLAQLLASENDVVVNDSSYFSKLPLSTLQADTVRHPLLTLFNSNIDLTKARLKMLNRTMLPTLGLWGTTFARGSGIRYDGTINTKDGLSFQRYNYGIGLQLSVPLLQSVRINPQLQQQQLLIKSNEEKLNEVSLKLKSELRMADTALSDAVAAAKENPVLVESTDFAYNAMVSRYQSGLVNYSELIQAQYQLIKAEAENKTAFINVWKALLIKAAVTGDLNLFLNQVN